jgi:glycerol-3-phosphate dehydrogenase
VLVRGALHSLNVIETSQSTFDVIVIGAGINGAGIARDAAMRGLQVLLLDKGDIGGGTSAWSTRLIHGGLRYLEHFEFGLVRESLRERETLLRIAPHLVRPLPILIPLYEHARRSSALIRAGMLAYDLLSLRKSLSGHRMLSRAEALEEANGLCSQGLKGAALYYDAQVEFAERLVLENVRSAVEHGATVQTYAKVTHLHHDNERIGPIEFSDQITGETSIARGRIVINAAGPWVDTVLNEGGPNGPGLIGGTRLIGGTKGSHIVVADFAGAPRTALYVEAANDGRPFFIIPWNGNYLIGTTDIRYEGNPDDAQISAAEIDYLLDETNRIIPNAKLNRDSILFSYSGVRPLPYTSEHSEAKITRRHFIRQHPRFKNLFSIVGGKLTTYRSLAEEAVNLVGRELGQKLPACQTSSTPLPGALNLTDALVGSGKIGLSDQTTRHLSRVYGSRAAKVLEIIDDNPELIEVIDSETGAIAAEVVHAFRNEAARTIEDCLMRRTMIGLNSSRGQNAFEAVNRIVQQLGHDPPTHTKFN